MTTTNLMSQALEQQSTVNGAVYFPFVKTDQVIVQSVLFDKPTDYKIRVVEGFDVISEGKKDELSISLGNVITNCLVVETTEEVKVKVLTLKNK